MVGRESGEIEPLAGIADLDRLLEHRLRLAVAVLLARHEVLSFARLKEVTGETDGNLGANLRKLEEAGYLAVSKEFADRKPVSWYALTAAGRIALKKHLAALSRVVEGAAGSLGP